MDDESNDQEPDEKHKEQVSMVIESAIDSAAQELLRAVNDAQGLHGGFDTILRAIAYAYVLIAVGMRQDHTAIGTPVPLDELQGMMERNSKGEQDDDEETIH